jgi:hypothetical protein
MCVVLCGCEPSPVHTSVCSAHTRLSEVARIAALARTAPQSLPRTSPAALLTGLSSLAAGPAHTAIDSSSAASSSMQADTRGMVKRAEFETLVTHQVDEMMSVFATVAACGSRTPRACRRWVCYCFLVSGTACTALTSRSAYERVLKDGASRCTGAAGRVATRPPISLQASGASQLGSSPRFWYLGAPRKLQHGQR